MTARLLYGGALIGAAVLLGVVVATGALAGFDTTVMRALAMTAASPHALVSTVQTVSSFGNAEPRSLFIILFGAVFVARHCWRSAIAYALIVAASIGGHIWAKTLYARPRPHLTPWFDSPHDLSYPSGHAAGSMVVLLAFALLARERWLRWPAIALSVAIGLTRPMLGVHWPTDVIGGWMWGAGFALLGAGLAQRMGLPRPRVIAS